MTKAYVRTPHSDRASRFLARYENCRKAIENEERLIRLFERNGEKYAPQKPLLDTANGQSAICRILAPDKAEVLGRLTEDYRIFERMTTLLGHGVMRIKEKRERDYLVFHYFYHFTHESIAEVLHYSERQIYRVACASRTSLSKTLRIPPMAKHVKFRRYRAVFHPQKRQSAAARLAS